MTAPGLRNVVRLRQGFPRDLIDNELLSYRFYTAWAAHIDLDQLIENHRRLGAHVPEPMVWYVAEALAECGKAMQHGSSGVPVPNWDQIVHR